MTPQQIRWCVAIASEKEAWMNTLNDEWNQVTKEGEATKKWLRDEGLIDDYNEATARLYVFVEHLCAQPLPIQKWVMSS